MQSENLLAYTLEDDGLEAFGFPEGSEVLAVTDKKPVPGDLVIVTAYGDRFAGQYWPLPCGHCAHFWLSGGVILVHDYTVEAVVATKWGTRTLSRNRKRRSHKHAGLTSAQTPVSPCNQSTAEAAD